MDFAQQKEKFSDAYLQAVVAVAGFALAKPNVDNDSVDWMISARGTAERPRRPQLDVQLKCSARDIVRDTHIHYPLELKNYNDLRYPNPLVPRILVVVTVPDELNNWLYQTEEELLLRHCGYWINLRGEPDTTNMATVTIRLP